MLTIRSAALPLSLALLGAVYTAPASACSRQCEAARQPFCLWDDDCGPRVAVQPRLTLARWEPVMRQGMVRTFTRLDVEAVRLFQRMP